MRVVRPLSTVAALVRFYFRVLPSGWYRRFPFLPIPPSKYVRWRYQTAYGQIRPPFSVLIADLWQFGGWLADSDKS